MRLGRFSARPGSLLVTAGIAALLILTALAVTSAIAGWSSVTGRLQLRLSFWFALAFVAEAAAFAGYVFAYRSVAAIQEGPRLELREAAALVAFGFDAFLAKGGAALDSKALATPSGGKPEGEIRVMALDALEHAPLAPVARAAAIALLAQG